MKKRIFLLAGFIGLALLAVSFIYWDGTQTSTAPSGKNKTYIYSYVKAAHEASANPKLKTRNIQKHLVEQHRFAYEAGKIFKWTHHEGDLWVIDEFSAQVRQLSSQGEVRNTYGQEGDAPWENRSLRQLDVNEQGIYTLDNTLMTMRQTSFEDEMAYYHKEKRGIWDGVRLSDDKFLLLYNDDGFEFATIDARTGERSQEISFQEAVGLNRPFDHTEVVFEGFTVKGSDDRAYYICSKAGVFLAFNGDGSLAYHNTTIDGKAPPKVSTREMGDLTFFVKEPDYSSNYAACADAKHLYVLSLIAFQPTETLSVDVYQSEDGRYSHSFKIPNLEDGQLPVDLLKLGDLLYVLYEEQDVVAYQLQDLQV